MLTNTSILKFSLLLRLYEIFNFHIINILKTMTTAQQVFALDARYNVSRTCHSPNFRILYIRRRSQLLREAERTPESWQQYYKLRSLLLQQQYGNGKSDHLSSTRSSSTSSIVSPKGAVIPTKEAEASRAIVGGTTISENYAFVGVQHIFDQHTDAVTMVKFANNNRSRLCCSSLDHTLSICDVMSISPEVISILRGHHKAVTGFDWSSDNDSIVSCSLDGTIRVWKVNEGICLRTICDPTHSQVLCCIFHPCNNNLVLTGNNKGELRLANVSTGRFLQNSCKISGSVLSIASGGNLNIFWVGNSQGEIISVFCELSGCLSKLRKISLLSHCSVTNLSYRVWINREARNPLLLVNATDNSMYLFSVTDCEGELRLIKKFQNRHQKHIVRSTFCPIMSFRQGSVVVTGSEDGSVYFVDVEKIGNKAVVNTLQGHSSAVLGISFNYDESLLATSDLEGLVIIWKKSNME